MQVADDRAVLLLRAAEGIRGGIYALFSGILAALCGLYSSLLALVPTSDRSKIAPENYTPSFVPDREQAEPATASEPTIAEVALLNMCLGSQDDLWQHNDLSDKPPRLLSA